MGKNQHVTPHTGGGWQVIGAGNSRATVRTNTQAEAIAVAREIARNQGSELVIHGADGRIREKDSHGHDPHPAERLRTKRQFMGTRHKLPFIFY